MLKYSDYIQEKSHREYNNILKKMNVMNQSGEVDFANMTQKINSFLNSNNNKKKFLKDVESDDVKGEKIKIKVFDLKPGQTTIFLDQVIERLLDDSKFTKQVIKGELKDRDILISSDNYIIDGHHRWCGSFILNPNCNIKCTKINLPIDIAVPILNGILKATDLNSDSQNESGDEKHNIYTLMKDNDLKNILSDLFQKVSKDLWNGKKSKKKVEKLFSRIYKLDNEKTSPTTYLSKNIYKFPNPEDDLADREDMPQINDKIEKIVDEF